MIIPVESIFEFEEVPSASSASGYAVGGGHCEESCDSSGSSIISGDGGSWKDILAIPRSALDADMTCPICM